MKEGLVSLVFMILLFALIIGGMIYVAETMITKTKVEGLETFGVVTKVNRTSQSLKNRRVLIEYCDIANVQCAEISFRISSLELDYNVGDTVKMKYLPNWFSEPVVMEDI